MVQPFRSLRCVLTFSTFLMLSLVACDGGSGDPCQVETDCDDGLLCCGAARFGNPTRGVCAASCADLRDDASMPDATSGDAMMSMPDSAAGDGAVDGSTTPEASVDASADATVDAQVDASAPDASGDAG